MKLPLLMLLASSSFCFAVFGQSDTATAEADQLLEDAVARLPRAPLKITGDLLVRRRRGVPINRFSFEMQVNWGELPSVARYTIRDAFGTDLERLTVIRDAGGTPSFQYASGQPLEPHKIPPLFDSVQVSDISWVDLALSFLWWRGGRVTGADEVRGRRCYVVEVPAPVASADTKSGQEDAMANGTPYARVRLWIDEELRMLLQAEGLDAEGDVVRKLWIKSFKKVDDRWMIKDMEVQRYPIRHRTRLSIKEIVADTPL